MPTLQEISDKADALQVALDFEQQQVADAIAARDAAVAERDVVIEGLNNAVTGLNEQIEVLSALVAEGGTSDERQAVVDKLEAVRSDLESTIPDEA